MSMGGTAAETDQRDPTTVSLYRQLGPFLSRTDNTLEVVDTELEEMFKQICMLLLSFV